MDRKGVRNTLNKWKSSGRKLQRRWSVEYIYIQMRPPSWSNKSQKNSPVRFQPNKRYYSCIKYIVLCNRVYFDFLFFWNLVFFTTLIADTILGPYVSRAPRPIPCAHLAEHYLYFKLDIKLNRSGGVVVAYKFFYLNFLILRNWTQTRVLHALSVS
jgi:hypothetical protein